MGLSTTIYAKWTADNQTLTFNSNGGSPVTAITQAFGTTVNAPTDPTKTGYTFAGWYNEVGLTTPYTFPHTMGLSTTIYAKWTALPNAHGDLRQQRRHGHDESAARANVPTALTTQRLSRGLAHVNGWNTWPMVTGAGLR